MSLLNRITQNTTQPRTPRMQGEPFGSLKSRHPTKDYGRDYATANRAAKVTRCRALIEGGMSQENAAKEAFGHSKWVRGLLEVNGGEL